ncbi:hypothetical protein R3P38DRAFT_3243567 [Favolaschia claudopus]|uniref:Apple domain-containing protein n=1 Tax=Favolaschia claudopus TaxID=2862362 RepID=A0AAV9Z339_9AGAR
MILHSDCQRSTLLPTHTLLDIFIGIWLRQLIYHSTTSCLNASPASTLLFASCTSMINISSHIPSVMVVENAAVFFDERPAFFTSNHFTANFILPPQRAQRTFPANDDMKASRRSCRLACHEKSRCVLRVFDFDQTHCFLFKIALPPALLCSPPPLPASPNAPVTTSTLQIEFFLPFSFTLTPPSLSPSPIPDSHPPTSHPAAVHNANIEADTDLHTTSTSDLFPLPPSPR